MKKENKKRNKVTLNFSSDNLTDNFIWQFLNKYKRKAGGASGFIKGILYSIFAAAAIRGSALNIPPSSQEKEEEPQVSTSPSSQKEEEKPQVFTREMLMNLIPSDLREFYEPEEKKSEDQNG